MKIVKADKKWIKEGSRLDHLLHKQFSSSIFSYREIFSMLLPLILDSFFVNIIGILTTAMISSSSQESVSAVSLVNPIGLMLYAIYNALAAGGTVLVAQAKGKGDKERMRMVAGQVMLVLPLVAIVSCAIMVAACGPVVNLMFGSADPSVLLKAKDYLVGQLISSVFLAFYMSAFSILRGIGETRKCLGLTMLINITHLVLSLIFINFLHLDILGTVLSLNLARLTSGAFAVYIMMSRRSVLRVYPRNIFRLEKEILSKIFKIGIPFALEQFFMNGGAMLVQTYIVLLGTVSMAANAVGNSAINLFFSATLAVGTLAVTIVGQCVGAGDRELTYRYGNKMILLGVMISCLSLVVLTPLMPVILKLYQSPADTVSIIYRLLAIGGICLPFFFPVSAIMPNVMRAAGDVKFSSYFSLVTMWIVRVFFGYIFAIPLGLGVYGVWISMCLEWAVRTVVLWIRYRKGIWMKDLENI